MRRSWSVLLLVVLALAGCADEPEPLVPIEGTLVEHDGPVPGRALAPLEWVVVAQSGLVLSSATPQVGTVTIPGGTIQTLVNATLDAGAAYGLRVTLADCTWQRDLALVAQGQTIGADCGGVVDGRSELRLATQAGALSGTIQVVALVCHEHQGVCPPRLPATSD